MGTLGRLLVVDDEPGVLATFAANLELEGFDVHTASSATAAIEVTIKKGPFDLLITDLRMPGMTGAELIRRLRVLQPGIPVILMTAYVQESVVEEVVSEGVFTVISKPFDIDAVIHIATRASKKPFVLVVDDARTSGTALASTLEGMGLRARAVSSPGEAMLAVDTDNVDVAIVDAAMAGRDGAVLTAEIREKKPNVSVIAVSDGSEELFSKAAAAGAFGCLRRPLDKAALARMIARARGVAA